MSKKIDKYKILSLVLKNLRSEKDFNSCLSKTLTDLKLSETAKEKIVNEIAHDGINSFVLNINNFLNDELKKKIPQNFKNFRVNEKIRFLVILRLKLIDEFFNKVDLVKLALKQKSFVKLNQMIFNVSDEIWFLSGDTSTDFNYYSKRGILMNIYSLSYLYNLNQEDFLKTEKFINKQIDLTLMFGKVKSKFKKIFQSKAI